MSSWKQVRFSEICDITRGGSPRPIQEYMTNDGVPWIKISDATASNSRFIEKTKEFIKTSGISKSREVFPDDLILSNSATPGIPKFMRIYACIHDGWLLLRNFNGAEKEFIYWLLLNERDKLIQQGNGSVFTNLKTDILKNHIVNIPDDIEEQKRIATILNNIQEKIELNTQINQTLEQIAQTIFKSWFIDFDPVHAKANALASGQTLEQATQAAMAVISGKNTQELHRLQTANPKQYQQLWEIAEAFPSGVDEEGVPRGWEEKPLDEIAIYQNGLALQKFRPESEDEYLPVVKIAQLKQGYADGEEKASVNIKPECIIDNGDVIFSWSGSLVVDIWCGGKAALNQHLFKVTSKNYPKWLYYFYTVHHLAEFQRIAADKAVTMGHIKREHLSQALCVIPDNEFIQKFCFLEDYISQIVNNRLQNVSLRKTRDELLPKLLSGEIYSDGDIGTIL
ncbi:restriction endonuclease subunit S [Glaesserella parasuis]|uniref:restriction endonuclease subunit S n=1 Tax=Glaesserella parasuis TaxID=738 RepID=UPI0024368273|nr:restriction endonuclease subunit S [Glaesserella parasuis]MDG6287201.1 restriction endonuclease subunit S [Glaesserella parasuis]MDG6289338.1 restriction endonuclease subunit S [Glaesserella parasuis]MDG6291409.1 restriction endonuclease subunit S [Glaesserella parasuis]MDG6293462.1 restriction endonuclease subunit S [Glaesserella parasuis]